jgi:hypothetical protein
MNNRHKAMLTGVFAQGMLFNGSITILINPVRSIFMIAAAFLIVLPISFCFMEQHRKTAQDAI